MNVPPPGVTLVPGGATVAVFSQHAEAIEFCTHDTADAETGRVLLTERTGPWFHGSVPGITEGTRYGLRAHGPFRPAEGHRFNPSKLLVDPYAVALDRPFRLHPAQFDTAERPSTTDSAAFVPKALALPPPAVTPPPPPPRWSRLVIYELHVRGFSQTNQNVPPTLRGTFAGLGHAASIDYLQALGITAVEIMPCAAWIDERHLPPRGLSNYWGYNPVVFAAPDPRLAPGGFAEIAACVAALRAAGIATLIDVVFNHTGESDHLGPTLSLRGLDNAHYYRLQPDNPSRYVNDAGTGNILAADRPGVIRLVMESLRLWSRATGADGFRFDLAPILGRRADGFDSAAPLLAAIAQDPLLAGRVLIAEPWDVGPGGHQLGSFGGLWGEWNDRFRDTARRFWRGDSGMLGQMATRLAGSADIFAPTHRPPSRSINFITSHDGLTLADLVSYTCKRNDANGEGNRDGTDDNLSWNCGEEGSSDDPAVRAARQRDSRALLATLLFARGTPMLGMGDECGRTQAGNNNAYAQDNALSWMNWGGMDAALLDAARRMIALRLETPALSADRRLTGGPLDSTMYPDVAWLRDDGDIMQAGDWLDPQAGTLIALFYAPPARALLILNPRTASGKARLPPPQLHHAWSVAFDTAAPDRNGLAEEFVSYAARSVLLLLETPAGTARRAAVTHATLHRLAAEAGLATRWWDVAGTRRDVEAASLQALLAALHLPAITEAQARDSLGQLAAQRDLRPLPPALSGRVDQPIALHLGPGTGGKDRWLTITDAEGAESRLRVAAEDGESEGRQAADGSRFTARTIHLPPLGPGRYRLRLEGVPAVTHLTVAPPTCFVPDLLAHGGRAIGIASHLYTLRGERDQGIGDFTVLAADAAWAARQGAALFGVNPLHALYPDDRDRASPYHPSDRRFLDPIYIDVTALGPLAEVEEVRAALAAAEGAMAALRRLPHVDYGQVWRLKSRILAAAFAALPRVPALAAAFAAYRAAQGEALDRYVTWEAIAARHGADWRDWPAELADPAAPAVAQFARREEALCGAAAFRQFLADTALARASEAGLEIGLYRDLAVGCAPDGAEAWACQAQLLSGVTVGAPPDPIGPLGQNWTLPAPDPLAWAEDGYAAFGTLLAANMRHAGALRIDHVMGLKRLFLIPEGAEAGDGSYLAYPAQDLLRHVTLESQRARCLVIGEDLGTVPPEIVGMMAEHAVLSYRVLWFERDEDAAFRAPAAWPANAAACVSTHDLPTLVGWWTEADIDERVELGLLSPEAERTERAERAAARAALEAVLRAEGLPAKPGHAPHDAAVHALVARTRSAIALVQADDLARMRVGLNLPGTDRERPNWRRRLTKPLGELGTEDILAAMREERPAGSRPG